MYEPTLRQDPISRLRRRAARLSLNYPTDPLSLGLCTLGSLCLLLAVVTSAGWGALIVGTMALTAGITGLVIARGRHAVYAPRVTIGGATLSLAAAMLSLAPRPVWWMTVLFLGVALSAMVIYYWGATLGAVWGGFQVLMAFLSILLATADPEINIRQLIQALLAGEAVIAVAHIALILFMPEQIESQARNTAIARQSRELDTLAMQISATADGVGRASSAIHLVTSQQSSGAEQQAAVITQAVAMLKEFLEFADRVRTQARDLTDLSEQTALVSESGQQTIQQVIEGMAQVRSQVTAIAHNIAALAEQMERIDQIIASVSEIATQSNLLALNASIEAARAGAHGRGFAVVAEEVRTLAQQSKMAASQVQGLLAEIQEAMKQTVRATQTGDQQVDEGMDLSRQAGEVITQLGGSVAASTQAMRQIMTAIDQQATGLEQIAQSMRNIHEITQQNLASTRMAESVAETLSRLSEELLSAIARHTGGRDGSEEDEYSY